MINEQERKNTLEFAMGYEICNAHCHIYPEKMADKAVVNIGKFYDLHMDFVSGTSERLIEDGSSFGVKKYLVCSAATDPSQVESINNFIMAQCKAHPEFIGLGTLHPDYEGGFEKEIQRCLDGGLAGIKLHPDFQRFNIDDERALPMYEAGEGKIMFLIHMGDDRYDFSSPKRLKNAMDRFKGLEVFAAHLGGYLRWDEAREYLAGTDNLWYDCSSSLAFFTPEKATEQIRALGTDRVFFGTDFPMWDHASELFRFSQLLLTEEERRAILSENFLKYFRDRGLIE